MSSLISIAATAGLYYANAKVFDVAPPKAAAIDSNFTVFYCNFAIFEYFTIQKSSHNLELASISFL